MSNRLYSKILLRSTKSYRPGQRRYTCSIFRKSGSAVQMGSAKGRLKRSTECYSRRLESGTNNSRRWRDSENFWGIETKI